MTFNMSSIMDALAEALIPDVTTRAFPWPVESITVPCAVVGYPEFIEFDYTFSDGSDRSVFPVYFVVGKASDRTIRDELSAVVAGSDSIKEAIDGTLDGVVQMARVTEASVTEISVNGIQYMALQVNVEIIS